MDWYNVDLPNVIALRDELMPANDHAYSVAASLAENAWTDQIPSDRPTMLIPDGLLAFLSESVIINLFRHIPDHFRSGELALNDYGRVGRSSLLAMKVCSVPWKPMGLSGFQGRPRSRDVESATDVVEEASLSHAPEVDLYPAGARVSTRLMGMTKAGARTARILRYRF